MQEVVVLGVGMHRFGKTGDAIVGTKSVGELCRHAVDAALKDAGYNRSKAAKLLGIGERTLRRKLNES